MLEAGLESSQVLSYEAQRRGTARFKSLVVLAWLYPFMPLAGLYVTWLAAWIALGHVPRSSLDDPKEIGALVVPYVLTVLLLGASALVRPLDLVMGVLLMAWYARFRRWRWWSGLAMGIGFISIYVGCRLLLKWDPLNVMYWFMD